MQGGAGCRLEVFKSPRDPPRPAKHLSSKNPTWPSSFPVSSSSSSSCAAYPSSSSSFSPSPAQPLPPFVFFFLFSFSPSPPSSLRLLPSITEENWKTHFLLLPRKNPKFFIFHFLPLHRTAPWPLSIVPIFTDSAGHVACGDVMNM